jgi:ABC-type multidrug transport system fused ATPase/permease subunit
VLSNRVSLARAVYADRDIYLLDDCLSAVDQRVAKHIFEKCMMGYLKGKCVVMVTNHIHFAPFADKVV